MNLSDLPTPALILDVAKLRRNVRRMADAVRRNGVALRPHMKTAKSIDVARIVLEGQAGGIAVSTLREAEYFAGHGIRDIQYAVSIVPDKLARVAQIQKTGARVTLITDNVGVACAIAAKGAELGATFHVLIEVDCSEGRSGVLPGSEDVLTIGRILHDSPNTELAGIMTHAGHSYRCRGLAEVEAMAETERAAAVAAADRLRAAGLPCGTVSVGSTPTALYARSLTGVTEARPGVYMFGDMFQAQIDSCSVGDLAVSVLAAVTSHRREYDRLLIDAGALALSKDRSTEFVANDIGFGLVTDIDGKPFQPQLTVARVYQEHGQVQGGTSVPFDAMPVGSRVRILPNHVCMTAAMYDRYHVVDSESGDGRKVIAEWTRANGW